MQCLRMKADVEGREAAVACLQAVGGASTMPATYKVSSYYPDNLKDNGLGLVSFPRPGFHDQIET